MLEIIVSSFLSIMDNVFSSKNTIITLENDIRFNKLPTRNGEETIIIYPAYTCFVSSYDEITYETKRNSRQCKKIYKSM